MLESINNSSLNEAICSRLKTYIVEENFKVGDKIPSENKLGELLGVSRNALREALRTLAASGMIEVAHGRGWYVSNFKFDTLASGLSHSLSLEPKSISELLEIRRMLEVAYIHKAAARLRPEDYKELRRIVSLMGKSKDTEVGEVVDYETNYHRLLYSRIENQLFQQLMTIFWSLLASINQRVDIPPSSDEGITDAHADIIDCLEAGQVDEAAEILDSHYDDLAERLKTLAL